MRWTLESAKAYLAKNGVIVGDKQIAWGQYGISTWGCIDYLCKVHGYKVVRG